jgi:hypothetical protein
MKKLKYHTVGTVKKSNRKFIEPGVKAILLTHICMTTDTPNTHIHDHSLSSLG